MPFEAEQRSHAEEPPAWEDLDAQNERLRQQNADFFEGVDREIRDKIEFYQRQCSLLSQEIEGSGRGNQLERDNPANLAINYTESSISPESSVRSQEFDRHCDILFAQPSEAIEGMPDLRRQVVAAHDQLAPSGQQGFISARRVLSVSLGLVLVAGLSALLLSINSAGTAGDEEPLNGGGDTLPELNRRAELTSLLLQAAANRPVDTARYGITPERFSSLREAVLAVVQGLPEESYWEQLALAAEAGYGADGAAYTLGDHFYALDLAFILMEPLLDSQPCELDLASWMNALGQEWQAGEQGRAGGGVPRLYRSIATQVPEESGATRLTRLFLARAVLAQAALQEAVSTPVELSARSKLGLSISANSFFQISGAAMFCLPAPFMAYGYLANTVLEVLFGSSNSSSSFLNGLSEAIKSIDQRLAQIETIQIKEDINALRTPIDVYRQNLENKYNNLPRPHKDDPNQLPPLEFFDDPKGFQQSLRGLLENSFVDTTGLPSAVSKAEYMWGDRQLYDQKGEWSLLLWLLVAYSSYLSCSRQLATTYATIANLRGNTNYQELSDQAWTDSYRPDRSVLLTTNGEASELSYWTSKHWSQVQSHIKLVKSDYTWHESLESKKALWNARLDPSTSKGCYDRAWFIFIDLWRRGQLTLSMPTEIYRWVKRRFDDASGPGYWDSRAFVHGWPASQVVIKGKTALDSADADLLPPNGPPDKPGSQQWLRQWYSDLCDLQKKAVPWLDTETATITPKDQNKFLESFGGIFTIGAQHQATWTFFLLKTIREQLQAWRLKSDVAIDITGGVKAVDKLHGAAWPTTGELNRIIRRLDQAVPCSWETGPDYLKTVLQTLKNRWQEMANSGSDPSGLAWMQGEKYWWGDRSNADNQPMPLLPETIVLVLEVWLGGAIRADRLQQPIQGDLSQQVNLHGSGDEAGYLSRHLTNNYCKFRADYKDPENIAYQIPEDLYVQGSSRREDSPNNKDFYDSNREIIRQAWVRKRENDLDQLLNENYGLTPSSITLGLSESMAQNWINGLLDLNDDLKLRTPDKLIQDIQMEPGLDKPTLGALLWKPGNTVSYSYQLRRLSSFQAIGNDSLSEESDLSAPITLDEETVNNGIAMRIPRDEDMLASQFLIFRKLVDTSKPKADPNRESKIWIGSGHFNPGQIEPSIFHDGNPPIPSKLDNTAVTIEKSSKPPKGVSHWINSNKIQYGLQYFDARGKSSIPTKLSELSDPIEISNDACGFKLKIPSDPLGIATSVQVKRTIIDRDGQTLEGLKTLDKVYTFPFSDHPGTQFVEVLDADVTPPSAPVVFRLRMTTKGLELSRTDQPTPVWTTHSGTQNPPDLTSCRMQGDGNLVIYDKNLCPHWASNTMETEGKTNSEHVLRLRANGELAIVNSIKDDKVIKVLLAAAQPPLPLDRPDVFLRRGEMMLPDQILSIDNQSPQRSI